MDTIPPKTHFVTKPTVPSITLKDIPLYSGKYVFTTGVVFAHKILDTLEALAIGGAYPNQSLTVFLHGKAFDVFKAMDIDGKRLWIGGIIQANKDNKDPQMFISNTQLIFIIKQR